MKKDLSIVVSVYNEEENINPMVEACLKSLDELQCEAEIILVNDGSIDESRSIIDEICLNHNDKVKAIHFSRNFGHEAAMIAGIDHANANAVICMDADLQHPPHLIPRMYAEFLKGSQVVLMKRNSRMDGGTKGLFSRPFYRFLSKISRIEFAEGASDFFLVSGKVGQILRHDFRERNRFIRGFIQSVGFKHSILNYDAPARVAGKSSYSFRKLMSLSSGAIAAFSNAPLNLSLLLGVIMGLLSIGVGVYSLVMFFVSRPVSGYTTLVVLISFLSAVQFFLIGILGKYIGFLFDEIKKRPIYIVEEKSFEDD